jgi:hypothetical protein
MKFKTPLIFATPFMINVGLIKVCALPLSIAGRKYWPLLTFFLYSDPVTFVAEGFVGGF